MNLTERHSGAMGRHPGRRAFTLTEVLVVVFALALLVALLMPALGGARSQARALVCRCDLAQPKDMVIDEKDLAAFASQWGQTEAWRAAVPSEPDEQ